MLFLKRVELLAPGGDSRSVKAAILAGADAVYLGVGDFNARKRAVNISLPELEELCLIAHKKGSRVYLTFNVLALEEDFQSLIDFLRQTVDAGIDAVIVQDYGLLSVIHKVFPILEIHASTQMTNHNRGQIRFLSKSGVKQVNFSRELSLEEIRDLSLHAHEDHVKVEIFVHGAYCVSFSGQCYLSGALYDNSANRGACVQPCRREYSSGQQTRGIRPLNLKDNSLYSSARELVEAGADSLKIEGRIKGHEYVYTTVTAWREQLDRIVKGTPQRQVDQRLDAVFNRAFSDNLLQGRLGKDSFTTDPGDQSFHVLSKVEGYHPGKGELMTSAESNMIPGQSVTIRTRSGQFVCTGTLTEKSGTGSFYFRIEHKLKGKILKGQEIWSQPRIFDFEKIDSLIDSMRAVKDKIPLSYKLLGSAGKSLTLIASAGGREISLQGLSILEKAENQPTPAEKVVERLSKLGNTPFVMENCDLEDLEDQLFIPMKSLNQLRQLATSQLHPPKKNPSVAMKLPPLHPAPHGRKKRLAVAVSVKEDLEQIPEECLRLFQLPADPFRLDQTLPLFNEDPDLIPWFPPILIGDQYEAACHFLTRCGKSRIITDNTGIAAAAQKLGISWTAGPLLNGANGYALNMFLEKGAEGAFLSSELSIRQIRDTTIPEGIEFWASLVAPTLLMNSRHCLIINCLDCEKDVMDGLCLRDCRKKAEIVDSQKNTILLLKPQGEYNSLYNSRTRLTLQHLEDPRIGVLLLDFRVSHRKLKPLCSLNEFIKVALRGLEGHGESQKQLKPMLNNPDLSERTGLDCF